MLKQSKPTSSGVRHKITVVKNLTTSKPEKSLTEKVKKNSGRNAHGHITTRHRGGGEKRRYRIIDFKRNKLGIDARVMTLEYDPNRSATIALLQYRDGEKRYILAPDGLEVDMTVTSGPDVEPRVGNALPLKKIPIGMPIHNIELKARAGAQMVRAAGTAALIQSKEAGVVTIKLPSGEIRLLKEDCFATIGQVSNLEHKNRKITKIVRLVKQVVVDTWAGVLPFVVSPSIQAVTHMVVEKADLVLVCQVLRLHGANQLSAKKREVSTNTVINI